MPPKVPKTIVVAMFFGGAIGASARYGIDLLLVAVPSSIIYSTLLVNLSGALLLGIVNNHRFFQSLHKKMFFGHGLLGSFTTMSALAVITATPELGLGANGFLYWLYVIAQLALGVLVYRAGLIFAQKLKRVKP